MAATLKPAAPALRKEAPAKQVPAVSRAFAVLRFLAQSSDPVGVQACARAVGLIPSTCFGILRTLVQEEAVVFDPVTKRYSLGLGLLAIATSVLRGKDRMRLVQEELDRLASACGVTAMVANVVDPDHSLVVAISHGAQAMRFNVGIGSRYPTLIGASGRCFAAFAGVPWPELADRFKKLKWARRPSVSEWRKEVMLTRMRGYASDVGDYIEGATVLAVPVLDGQRNLHSTVAAVGMTDAVTAIGVDRIVGQLRQVATNAGSLLRASEG